MTDQEVSNTVLRFYVKMNKWEVECALREEKCDNNLLDYDESRNIAMDQYRLIFDDHCSEKATPRDYHFSMPPEYDPDQMIIERIETGTLNSKNVFIQNTSGLKGRFVFRLRLEQNSWKILEKCYIGHDGKLIEANL